MRFSHIPKAHVEVVYKLVGFVVAGVRYGVDIMRVQEIVHPTEYVTVPAGPPHLVGVADHRSEAVPIIDLRLRFGLQTEDVTRKSKWVLVKRDGKTAALLVDRITEVMKITSENRRDRHSLLDQGENPWVGDVFADKKGLIFELDLESVIGAITYTESRQELGE